MPDPESTFEALFYLVLELISWLCDIHLHETHYAYERAA